VLKFLSSKKSLTLSLIVVFLFSISGTIFGTTNVAYAAAKQHYNMVALGDSLAAGQNPYGDETGYGYANAIHNYLAKAKVAGGYWNFGVSGMTSTELLAELTPGNTVYNQDMVDAIRAVGDGIVTVDIGADDMLPLLDWATKYPGSATEEWLSSYPGSFGELTYLWAFVPMADQMYGTNDMRKIVYLIGSESAVVQNNIIKILGTINGLNSNAHIYLMGYYDAFANYKFTPAQKVLYNTYFINMLGAFNAGLDTIANDSAFSSYVTFVPTFGDLTSDMLPGDIHPNRAGYIVIANQFREAIVADFGPF
jgi:lysophospholipase L1-like esterase